MGEGPGLGYKRKARVLFVSGSGSNAIMAAGFAGALGGGWLSGRAAALAAPRPQPFAARVMQEVGIDISGLRLYPLDERLLSWADLVVTLDPQADVLCPPLPGGVQKRFYPCAEPAAGAACTDVLYREIRDGIRRRVEGMIGGMRMLQRSAAD